MVANDAHDGFDGLDASVDKVDISQPDDAVFRVVDDGPAITSVGMTIQCGLRRLEAHAPLSFGVGGHKAG